VSYLHGIIHFIWPFLAHEGRVKDVSPFYDVVLHCLMMVVANNILGFNTPNGAPNKWYPLLYHLFMTVSIFNVMAAFYLKTNDEGLSEYVFDYSSIAQTISAGYWISSTLINTHNCPEGDADSKLLIKYNWIWCITFTTVNWMMFRNSYWLLGEAADRGYFQNLFIIPTVIGAIYLRDKSSSKNDRENGSFLGLVSWNFRRFAGFLQNSDGF